MKKSIRSLLLRPLSLLGCRCECDTEDTRMAYNIYSDPDISATSRSFDTFAIDFRGVQTPKCTYWALCNWGMDLKGSTDLYPGAVGGGAYAGMQNTDFGRKAIMAFWEVQYDGDKIMRASRVYPKGSDNNFGGEGEGTNWITPFEWKDNSWYRMVIHAWQDAEIGTTFVGQWIQDRENGKWNLISYFDTHLKNSFLRGNMSQFQENYHHTRAEGEREFNYKNFYVFDHMNQNWVSLSGTRLSYDAGSTNKKGTHSFGATEEYFWGKANGIVLEDQAAYNRECDPFGKYTIKQPETPTFGEPCIESLHYCSDCGKLSWKLSATGTPQLSYKAELLDAAGNLIAEKSETRPEVGAVAFSLDGTAAPKGRLTVTDIFDQSVTVEF